MLRPAAPNPVTLYAKDGSQTRAAVRLTTTIELRPFIASAYEIKPLHIRPCFLQLPFSKIWGKQCHGSGGSKAAATTY